MASIQENPSRPGDYLIPAIFRYIRRDQREFRSPPNSLTHRRTNRSKDRRRLPLAVFAAASLPPSLPPPPRGSPPLPRRRSCTPRFRGRGRRSNVAADFRRSPPLCHPTADDTNLPNKNESGESRNRRISQIKLNLRDTSRSMRPSRVIAFYF